MRRYFPLECAVLSSISDTVIFFLVGVSVSERDRFPSDGDHSDRVNFGPADCTGNETQLSECSVKSSSCFFEPTAGVKCYNGEWLLEALTLLVNQQIKAIS